MSADYYDAHNHLQDEQLSPILPSVIETVERLPVKGAVVNGTREADWPRVAALARTHSWLLPSYGLHPWWLDERSPQWEGALTAIVEQALAAKQPVGIGETGLDRWMRHPNLPAQEETLRAHIRLATRYNLPLSLHCLRAWGRLEAILREEMLPARGFLLHAYGGPPEMLSTFVKLGAYFSFSGDFLAPHRQHKAAPFLSVPPERLLAETDAPSMPLPPEAEEFPLPRPNNKRLNHPGNIAAVYRGLAHLRGWSLAETCQRLSDNYQRLFYPQGDSDQIEL